jgi:Arc/MetJ-type ribon-helix-helix transcriptional regulator
MTITLRPEHEKAINEAIKSGAYERPDDVIARALEVLRWEDGWLHDQKDEITAKIERGFQQFEHGEFLTAEESRADRDKQRAAWLAEHKR